MLARRHASKQSGLPPRDTIADTAAGNSAADETGRCAWHGQIARQFERPDPI
jgi:hypothetical protein